MWALIASTLMVMHPLDNPHRQYLGAVESQQATYRSSIECDKAVELLNRQSYQRILDGTAHKEPIYTCRYVA